MDDDRAQVISTPLQYALRYCALGWPVFACRENDKRPIAQGGFHTATLERAEVMALWHQHPRANIGIPAGRAWWVLDVDPRHGGNEALAALEDRYGELPQTLTAKTPSGGLHYYFAPDGRARNSAAKLGAGLDTRGDGGYVLVEGSSVNGGRYQFQDWDPLSEDAPQLAPAPEWLMQAAFGTPKQRESATGGATEIVVGEGGRNHFLARQAGRMRRMGYELVEMEPMLQTLNLTRCKPPLSDDEVRAIAASVARYPAGKLEVPHADEGIPDPPPHVVEGPPIEEYARTAQPPTPEEREDPPLSDRPQSRLLNLSDISKQDAPAFDWWVRGWLSAHPTLLSGRGGVGKSLLALQLAMGCAAGRPLIGRAAQRLRVLYWACEDDKAELHRRLKAIASANEMDLEDLADYLYVDSRLGLDNTLMSSEFGRPMWAPMIELLRQQLCDLKIDLLILDNLAHVFVASENDRSSVTMFAAGLCGLVMDRPWCPMLIGHVAKAPNSEYAGSTAWENAVRMRWYLGRALPDAKEDEEQTDEAVRVLAKRKSNYSEDDVLRLRVGDRYFEVEHQESDQGTIVGNIRERNVRKTVIDGLTALRSRNINASDKFAGGYLPKLLIQYDLAQGHSKKELERAMHQLIMSGDIIRTVVGKNANRMPKEGLILATQAC